MRIRHLLLFALAVVSVVAVAQQREGVSTKDAPKPIGPYAQAIKANGFVFTSTQIAFNPANGEFMGGDVSAQTDRTLKNIAAILRASGTDFKNAVKVTVYLKNISDYAAMNAVYTKFVDAENPPARATVAVAALPKDALVAIDVTAVVPNR